MILMTKLLNSTKYQNANSLAFLIYSIIKFNSQLMISFFIVVQLLNEPVRIKSSLVYNSFDRNHKNLSSYTDLDFKYNQNNNNNLFYKTNSKTKASLGVKRNTGSLFSNAFTKTVSSYYSKHLSRYNSTRLKKTKNSFLPNNINYKARNQSFKYVNMNPSNKMLSKIAHYSQITTLSSTDDFANSSLIFNINILPANDIDYIGYNQMNSNQTQSYIIQNPNESNNNVYDQYNQNNNYWALILLFIPIGTIFGNILVVMSVIREKNLRTVTNYFVVSLAIADLAVATAVMPFAVYYEVTKRWNISEALCDGWVALDVMASTASILNLVSIAIDRFIAVTQPLKYAQHKNPNRIYLTIAFVWLISIAIASPIVAGFNDTPDRVLFQCEFNNETFLIFSSIFSFFIPAIAMIILYYRIFKVIRTRAKNAALTSKSSTLRNVNRNNNDANKAKIANGSDKEKINLLSEGIFKLKNSKVNELNDNNINNLTLTTTTTNITNESEKLNRSNEKADKLNNLNEIVAETNLNDVNINFKELNKNMNDNNNIKKNSTIPLLLNNNDKKAVATTAILNNNKKNVEVKKNKAITVQRFQSSAMTSSNKERKVTKTLAIVLIVFLVCWSPFFSINNILKSLCERFKMNCGFITEHLISFLTWLGYLNSFLNPIIYTIFNIEFRKAFAKILSDYCFIKSN